LATIMLVPLQEPRNGPDQNDASNQLQGEGVAKVQMGLNRSEGVGVLQQISGGLNAKRR
jgi:hypothetical protein